MGHSVPCCFCMGESGGRRMTYCNEKTGALIESTGVLSGGDWERVDAEKANSKPTSEKATDAKKKSGAKK